MSIFTKAKTIKAARGGKVEVKCANKSCGKMFTARAADRARGWGKYCSKSCKAVVQEKRTGQYADFLAGERSAEGANRWTDDNGNQCGRRWGKDGRSIVSTKDATTGEVTIEQFDRHGISDGLLMSAEDLSHGGYGDADWDTPFGDSKF